MKFVKANIGDLQIVQQIIYQTINEIYPRYYTQKVVDFFLNHHNTQNILKDLKRKQVFILYDNNMPIGTGSISENHIGRLFVLPEFQNKGYGSLMMSQLEQLASVQYNSVLIDASLPAYNLYLKRNYLPLEYKQIVIENGDVLCYYTMQKQLPTTMNGRINYNNRTFISVSNSGNGEVSSQTTFYYHQQEDILWAEYSGGEIEKGFLVGKVHDNDSLEFTYHHVNKLKQMRMGKCRSIPECLDNGKIRLYETWEWMDEDDSKGESVIEEK